MNDKTKWENAHFEHDAHPVDGAKLKPAAAQEAVARQTMATCPRDGTVVLLHWGEDHVSPGWWSAPCAPVPNSDGTWPSDTGGFPWAFFDLRDGTAFVNHAVDTAYGPTHWSVYAAPVAAAPVDLYRQLFEAAMNTAYAAMEYVQRNQEKFNAKAGDDKLEIICREFLRAQVQSTPAAPGIDLAHALDIMWEWRTQIEGHVFDSRDVARTLTSPDLQAIGVDPMVCAGVLTIGEAVIAAKREITRALIDASPKGGSDAVAELAAAAEGVLWFDWSDNDSDAVASIERLRNSLNHMQATSAEVGE